MRAYALLQTKAVDTSGKRIFTGIATTPETDRVGDIIDPMGASFSNPLVLLHQHDHSLPIGSVVFDKPTKKGITFTAEIPTIDEPGTLQDRCNTAWGEIVHGMVRGVSIGFIPKKYAFLDDGGVDFQEIEIYELSTVSVPANAAATIQTIKALGYGRDPARGVQLIQRAALSAPRDPKAGIQLIRPSDAVRL